MAVNTRSDLLGRAELAEQAQRYDDMAAAMRAIVVTETPEGKNFPRRNGDSSM